PGIVIAAAWSMRLPRKWQVSKNETENITCLFGVSAFRLHFRFRRRESEPEWNLEAGSGQELQQRPRIRSNDDDHSFGREGEARREAEKPEGRSRDQRRIHARRSRN